jgi:hypothetical protein
MKPIVRTLALFVFPLAILPAFARADAQPACNAWEVEYAATAQLRLSDTTMGAGDGTHAIGPGRIVLRWDDVGGQPGGSVKLTTYEMTDKFTVAAHVLGMGTTVVNDTVTRTTGNVCGVAAEGALGGDRRVRWPSPWSGVHTDGTQICSGSMCGKFGAPARGQSAYHTAPHPVAFKPFAFAADMKSFHMDEAVTNRTSRDTVNMTLDGRETRRACIAVTPCP